MEEQADLQTQVESAKNHLKNIKRIGAKTIDIWMYGLDEALILDHFYHYTVTSQDQTKFYDGRYWNWDSYECLQKKFFQWMTPRQIKYKIEELVFLGVLIVGEYNQDRFKRTNWYTIGDNYFLNYSKYRDKPTEGEDWIKVQKEIKSEWIKFVRSKKFQGGDNFVRTGVQSCTQSSESLALDSNSKDVKRRSERTVPQNLKPENQNPQPEPAIGTKRNWKTAIRQKWSKVDIIKLNFDKEKKGFFWLVDEIHRISSLNFRLELEDPKINFYQVNEIMNLRVLSINGEKPSRDLYLGKVILNKGFFENHFAGKYGEDEQARTKLWSLLDAKNSVDQQPWVTRAKSQTKVSEEDRAENRRMQERERKMEQEHERRLEQALGY